MAMSKKKDKKKKKKKKKIMVVNKIPKSEQPWPLHFDNITRSRSQKRGATLGTQL